MEIMGYTYEADMHCTSCTIERFGDWDLSMRMDAKDWPHDSEGNPVHVVWSVDEYTPSMCGTCHENLIGNSVVVRDGSSGGTSELSYAEAIAEWRARELSEDELEGVMHDDAQVRHDALQEIMDDVEGKNVAIVFMWHEHESGIVMAWTR